MKRFPLLCALAAAMLCGCNDNDVDDRTPPPGLGTLSIANNSYTDLDVFIDGRASPRVKDGHVTHYDLTPGVHRVVLQDDNDMLDTWASDVDLLEGRQTVLEVENETLGDDFDVRLNIR